MGAIGTALKAFLTVLVLGGLFAAYVLVGWRFEFGPFFGLEGLLFWVAFVTSVLIFIWGILPRWLVLLSWTILVVYFSFLVSDPRDIQNIQIYLALVLFGLFLIFLAKWIRDVLRVRRLVRGLDARTLRHIQATVRAAQQPAPPPRAEETEGTSETPQPASGAKPVSAQGLMLDVGTVKALRDLAAITDQIERRGGNERERVVEELKAFEERLVLRSVKSSRSATVFSIVLFILGSALGVFQSAIFAWFMDIFL